MLIVGGTEEARLRLARIIHGGDVSAHPFIEFRASILAIELISSELSGFRRGHYGCGQPGRFIAGRLENACAGAAFIDDIETVGSDAEERLERFLATGMIRRLGETDDVHVDARLMVGTPHADVAVLA